MTIHWKVLFNICITLLKELVSTREKKDKGKLFADLTNWEDKCGYGIIYTIMVKGYYAGRVVRLDKQKRKHELNNHIGRRDQAGTSRK